MNHQVVCFGEILFDILDNVAKPGGAPFNVAYHLNQAGMDSFLISSVGDDSYGKQLLGVLSEWGLETNGVDISDTYKTGTAIVNKDANGQPQFELVFPVAWDHIPWKEEYAPIITKAKAFIFGSLSSRNNYSNNTLKECL